MNQYPQQMPYSGQPSAVKRRRTGLIAGGGCLGLFVILAACGAVLGAVNKTTTTTSGTAHATVTATHLTPSPSATVIPLKPQVFSGHGDKIVRIKHGSEPWLAILTHKGSANFIVDSLGTDGREIDSLVNEIGRYSGTVLLSSDDEVAAIKIQADGRWTLRLAPPANARVWHGTTATGHGDEVIHLATPSTGLTTARLTHRGRANFIVDAYSEGSDGGNVDSLVNEIGHYSGEVQLPDGTFLIAIHADGAWTMVR
jgi:hypothetical protein